MEETVELKNLRNIKNFEEELKDVYYFLADFWKEHLAKEVEIYYSSVIVHKIDRLCHGIPNFVLSPGIFQMVKNIFFKCIELKNTSLKNDVSKRIDDIYSRFKYLLEWCILYYEETYK